MMNLHEQLQELASSEAIQQLVQLGGLASDERIADACNIAAQALLAVRDRIKRPKADEVYTGRMTKISAILYRELPPLVHNPLANIGLAHTPEDYQELQKYCAQYRNGEAAVAATVMMMTNNLCHRIVDRALFPSRYAADGSDLPSTPDPDADATRS